MNRNKALAAASVAAVLVVGTAGLGIAQAGSPSLNTGATAVSPHAVPATVAGMPPTAQVLFGVVDANGALSRGFGATLATRVGTGAYEVSFRQNVRACAYSGTVGLSGSVGVSTPGQITVVGANSSVNRVFITTQDSAGNASDRGFHLTVAC